jgi:hypothetical protein
MRLTAAAFGSDFSPLRASPFGSDHAALGWLLAAVVAALVVLVWLVLRDADEELWLPGTRGGVLVSAAALERLAEEAAARDPDVVRAEADLVVRGGSLGGVVRVYGRPLGDAGHLAGRVGEAVGGALAAVVGSAALDVKVKPRILAVRQLARYLP